MNITRNTGPRVAILGLHLEANGFAPPTTRADFDAECWAVGEDITRLAGQTSHLPLEVPGFYDRMDATGDWQPVPVVIAAAQPGGPMEQRTFEAFMTELTTRLRKALPVDAVYVCSHGGSRAIGDLDNDGTIVVALRDIVGPDVPVVVTHDLHCAVSDRMIDACDSLIAYRTNPHVDHRECAAEAADMIRHMLTGAKTVQSFIRLPLSPPGVTMLMDGPYGDLIRMADAATVPPILNVSVTGGFVLTDLPKSGFTVNVTADGDQAAADRVAARIAQAAWDDRHRYTRDLLTLDQALALAKTANATARVCFAECADNPGGGGRGNTIWMIRALHEARVSDAAVGLFVDPTLAQDAHAAGEGAVIDAVFNRVPGAYAERFEARVRVVSLSDGLAIGRRGRDAGREIVLGASALLELEGSGLKVAVTSLREQLCDPIMLEMFGVDIAALNVLVVKSRGHFRAGFDIFFSDDEIFELDTPGMTSNVMTNFDFTGLTRPSYPLDPDTEWRLPDRFVQKESAE